MIKQFILIQSRPEDKASDNEFKTIQALSGLKAGQLERCRLESGEDIPNALQDYSGIIIGGGPFNISDPNKSNLQIRVETKLKNFLIKVIDKDYPLLGACYGIGLLTTMGQGVVSKLYGEDVGAVKISLTPAGLSEPLLNGLSPEFEAFVGHKEACEILPKNAILLASSATCPVQMFRIKNNVYATQFHPELDSNGLALRIRVYKNAGYFPPYKANELIKKGYRANVTQPPIILQNFVKRYSTPASS